ncbi:MAG TPA: hypothetical protein VK974_02610 [Methylophilaceae bacterium]|nr:hypothetical protein [Methylophilaceae bacterium]
MKDEIGKSSDTLWIKFYQAAKPKNMHTEYDIIDMFLKAHAQRIAPPAEIPDFDL